MKIDRLIFVYNAESGTMNSAIDFAHKMLSPETYECNLCKITYGNFAMKKEWKEFLKQVTTEVKFMYKNQFVKAYGIKDEEFPAVFKIKSGRIKKVLSCNELNSMNKIEEIVIALQQYVNVTNDERQLKVPQIL